MENNRYENCKITIELNGKPIFCAGWQDINLSKNKEDAALALAIINKYREYLNGFTDGIKFQETVKTIS
ncbi:hypothetical protein [Fluviicola sp.]|uniref:hypothetical protein n=1 Tax=Fluviicola sp. TaxID=1917219 RepID=UPI002622667F|nr:hypothetical protein [Fluviicola sp.]